MLIFIKDKAKFLALNRFLRFGLVTIGIIAIIVVVINWNSCECKKRISYQDIHINSDISRDNLLSPVQNEEVRSILEEWANFRYVSDSFQILKTFNYLHQRQFSILLHYAEKRKHYGAILFPTNYDSTKSYPLLLMANGLNQRDPSVNLNSNRVWRSLTQQLNDHFILVSSYRGQALVVGDNRYCSDGFFGDAFDGATDDVLRLFQIALQKFKRNLDRNKISIYGISRGSTVALLAGIRNQEIDFVIAQSGPTDFLRLEAYTRKGFQYKYQFLSQKKPLKEIRRKIIKSSPYHFINSLRGKLVLIHGKNDPIVPIWHSDQIALHFRDTSRLNYKMVNGGHRLNEVGFVVQEINAFNRLKN